MRSNIERKTSWFSEPKIQILISLGLLTASSFCMALSSYIYSRTIHWGMYAGGPMPLLTTIYMNSIHWFYFIILVPSALIVWLWKPFRLEPHTGRVTLFLHSISVIVFIFTVTSAFEPFLSTTFRMGSPLNKPVPQNT